MRVIYGEQILENPLLYIRGTNLRKSTAVSNLLKYDAYIRGTNVEKSTAVPKLPKYGTYIRGTNIEKSTSVPNKKKRQRLTSKKTAPIYGDKSKMAATVSGRVKTGKMPYQIQDRKTRPSATSF